MSDLETLQSIMRDIQDSGGVEVMEQKEPTHRGSHEQLTDLQQDLMEWRQIEDKQADREPAELGREV